MKMKAIVGTIRILVLTVTVTSAAFVVPTTKHRKSSTTTSSAPWLRQRVSPHLSATSSSSNTLSNWEMLEFLLSSASSSTNTNNNNNLLLGQADRALQWGLQLEKNGQARKASANFHEAATLYQCLLDSLRQSKVGGEFHHVSVLTTVDECRTILAFVVVRLASLYVDALGEAKAGVRLLELAVAVDSERPSAVTWKGLAQAIQAAATSKSIHTETFSEQETDNDSEAVSQGKVVLQQSIDAYRKALSLAPDNLRVQFDLAVALERLNDMENDQDTPNDESQAILETLRRSESTYACLVDSWGYVRWHQRRVPIHSWNLYRGTFDILQLALQAAMPLIERQGLVCEFGVGGGRSLRMTQEILPLDVAIHGFDTFTGLPQRWGDEPVGAYSTGGAVPNMEGKVYFHKGLFGDTIGPFLEEAGSSAFLAYANVDCDLYSSTLDVLESFHGRVMPGTIFVFDEYICHPTWRQDEFRAWRECCKRFGWKYEYLAFSLSTKQAVVRVTDVG